ncbi:hypothetical protein Tco_1023123, partial [Tanacetum coccineum]
MEYPLKIAAEVPQTLEYKGGQLNAAPTLEVKNSPIGRRDSRATYLDDEEDIRSSQEYMNDLEEEFHKRALLAKSKRFFKRVPKGSVVQRHLTKLNATNVIEMQKPKLRPTKDFEAKYNKVKAKLALFNSSALASKSSMVKNKGLVAKAYEWDEEDVSSDDNGMVEVKVFMGLVDDENVIVGKESAKNSEWVKVSMRKVHTLIIIEDNDDRETFLDYLYIDLNYVEEQRNNILSKHSDLVQKLNTCKEQ